MDQAARRETQAPRRRRDVHRGGAEAGKREDPEEGDEGVGEEGCGVVAGTGQGEILDGDEEWGGK